MTALRRLLFAALCAGVLAGIVGTAAHQVWTVPLILKAEQYEHAAAQVAPVPAATDHAAAGHAANAGAAAHQHGPADAGQAWAPEEGLERAVYTLAADVLAGIGFALLLAAGIALRGRDVTWRDGLFWGFAGFAVFTLAPGLGLPPDVPGSDAGPLVERQLWWLATAGLSAGGLALLAFARHPLYAVLGGALLLLPHLYGAPQPATDAAATVPPELVRQFAANVTLASLVFWAALGASTGHFYRLFAPRHA